MAPLTSVYTAVLYINIVNINEVAAV